MANYLAKKEEELNAKHLKELLLLPDNKKCFDCPTKSPFFVNISIQTFVCTRCSGLVREVGHRVKSISASKFSGPEIVALQNGGNQVARSIWLSKYHSNTPEPETDSDVRLFMRQKYYEQKWLDRQKAIDHSERVKKILTETFTADGSRRRKSASSTRTPLSPTSTFIPLPRQSLDVTTTHPVSPAAQNASLLVSSPVQTSIESNKRPSIVSTQSWIDDNTPIGIAIKSNTNTNLLDDLFVESPAQSPVNTTTPVKKSDIFSELAELSPIQPTKSATYSGGILQPNTNIQPLSSTLLQPNTNIQPLSSTLLSSGNNKPVQQKTLDLDPYAALRNLSIGEKPSQAKTL